VQWRTLVAEDGSESVAQILTALLKLIDVIELKRDVYLASDSPSSADKPD
jgi:hypothetical protein